MVPKNERSKNPFKQFGLAGKLSGMVIIIAVIVYIPSIIFGAFSNLKNKNAELADYKKGVEMRIQNAFEPAIWNYDIETLRKLISVELQNNNLKSIKISTEESTLTWLSGKDDGIVDETIAPEGKYIEKKIIPVYRMDEKERVIALASIWYDHSFARSEFLKDLLNDLLIVGTILTAITVRIVTTINKSFKRSFK